MYTFEYCVNMSSVHALEYQLYQLKILGVVLTDYNVIIFEWNCLHVWEKTAAEIYCV